MLCLVLTGGTETCVVGVATPLLVTVKVKGEGMFTKESVAISVRVNV